MADEFVTVTQAADRLGVSGEFVRRRLRDGDLVAFTNPRDGRSKLIPLDQLDRFNTPKPLMSPCRAEEAPSDTAA